MGHNVFAVQVFFIVFRECLEAVIVISVLLSFLKQVLGGPDQDKKIYKKLVRQVWFGSIAGVFICLCIGGAFIGVFYSLGHDLWARSEDLWEGIFFIIACVIITAMGLALLRINKMQAKWRVKIAQSLATSSKNRGNVTWITHWARRNVMFILPFVTTLREGVEAVVFVGGVSLNYEATAFPIPVITGLIAALVVGLVLYRGGNVMSIQIFLIFCTSVLYLIAAGMFSRAIFALQYYGYQQGVGSDVSEEGDGDGSYDITQTIWHVNCCNPETSNGWDVFNSILGWQNTGTYGSILGYIFYWIGIILAIFFLMYEEKTGYLPFAKKGLAIASKIPLVKIWANKRIAAHNNNAEEEAEQMQQAEAVIQNIQHQDLAQNQL